MLRCYWSKRLSELRAQSSVHNYPQRRVSRWEREAKGPAAARSSVFVDERHSEDALHLFKFRYLMADALAGQCKKQLAGGAISICCLIKPCE
jgi:hypothetical protein